MDSSQRRFSVAKGSALRVPRSYKDRWPADMCLFFDFQTSIRHELVFDFQPSRIMSYLFIFRQPLLNLLDAKFVFELVEVAS